MAPELGPGMFRRPPAGWLPGHAFAAEHRARNWPDGAAHTENIRQSVELEAVWEIRLDGREAYRFHDVGRSAPLWCSDSGILHAKRWYKVRLKPSHGLMSDVPIPVHVNPHNREDIWVDWDAGYDAHVRAWELKDRIDLEKARRASVPEHVVHRVMNPFAGRLKAGEEVLVDEAIAVDRAIAAAQAERDRPRVEAQMAAMGFAPVGSDEQAEYRRRREEMERVSREGRPATATVVSNEPTGRTLANIPVIALILDISDGGPVRRLVYEHVWGPRHAKRFKPGKQVDIHVDRADPNVITPV